MSPLKNIVAIALLLSTFAPAYGKKAKDEIPPPCPVDGTLRTADPKLLERFIALSGCADEILVAPATPSDFVDPDGTVIIGADRKTRIDQSDEASYDIIYASNVKEAVDDGDEDDEADDVKPAKKSFKKTAGKNGKNIEKGAKTEYYSYGAASSAPSLSGTGLAIRIVPEPQPFAIAPLAAGQQFGAGFTAPPSTTDAAILAMRPQSFRTPHDDLIGSVANTHRIDPLFLHAVIYQESRYRQTAVSHAGARGLMQIMPGTGRLLGVQPRLLTDPMTNVDAGARLLRKLHQKYGGNFDLMLAAYNAGEGAVQKYGNTIPPYRETQDYVKKVMAKYSELLAEQNGVAPAQ